MRVGVGVGGGGGVEKREIENDSTHRVCCTCSDDRTPRSVTSVLRRPRTELAPKRPSVVENTCLHCRRENSLPGRGNKPRDQEK